MSYWSRSAPQLPEIEVGTEYVTLRGKYSTRVARILRDETDEHGTRRLTLDRLLDRHASRYTERVVGMQRQWTAAGAFATELTCRPETNESEEP